MRATVVLVSVGAVLFLTWAVGVLSIIVGLRRADRARPARFPSDARARRIDFRTALLYSLLWSINLMTFVAVSGWYKAPREAAPASTESVGPARHATAHGRFHYASCRHAGRVFGRPLSVRLRRERRHGS